MPSDDVSAENFGKALDFVGPIVDKWIKELNKGFESLKISRPQKDLMQSLTVETMLYNTLMPNDEIIAVLGGIIQNIATKSSHGGALDWDKREEAFSKFSKLGGKK